MTGPVIDNEVPIFDVQSFSLHDGPGIRTTIFFKGCPLKCMWCHNPESQTTKIQLMFHRNLCVGCFLCVKVCARGAHKIRQAGQTVVHVVDHNACRSCGKCLEVCCYDALSLVGRLYSPRQLYEKIQGDLRYFLLDGGDSRQRGGITFSGGEPMVYPKFIRDFCALIPGVHRTIETSGHVPEKNFEQLFDIIDLFLFDFKATDPAKHKKWCGADNTLILSNLNFLLVNHKAIILRLPMIQGINDDTEHLDGIAELLHTYPDIRRTEIMPYHSYGAGKAETLGLPVNPELPAEGASRETSAAWLEALQKRGCTNVYLS